MSKKADTFLRTFFAPSYAAGPVWANGMFVFLLVVLFVGTLMPGQVKSDMESHLLLGLPWASMAHFVLFGAIAALPVYGRNREAFSRALLLALALAGASELLQSWVPGRHPLWRDVAIDISGALMGCAVRFRLQNLRFFYRP